MMTGAAVILLAVNTAAAGTGRPSAVATSARSRSPLGLMPAATPAATNPLAAVTTCWACSCGGDRWPYAAHGYRPTAARPAVSSRPRARLAHCTAPARRALDQVVEGGQGDDPAGAVVGDAVTWAALEPERRLGRRRLVAHDDERLGGVGLGQHLAQDSAVDVGSVGRA